MHIEKTKIKTGPGRKLKYRAIKIDSDTDIKSFTSWRRFLKKCLKVLILSILVLVAVLGTQYLSAWLFRLVVPSDYLGSSVVTALYSFVSYALAVGVIFYIIPHINIEFKTDKKHTSTADDKNTSIKKSQTITSTASLFKRPSRTELGLRGWPTWTDIGLAPVGYIVSILLASIFTAFFSRFPWFSANETQVTGFSFFMSTPERVLAFLTLVVVAPIAEELIFRGWLYGKFRRLVPVPIAIIVTSFLFAIVHGQWNVGVTVFALSIILCLQREVTGTIYSGILLHMLKNGIAFYLLYVVGIM